MLDLETSVNLRPASGRHQAAATTELALVERMIDRQQARRTGTGKQRRARRLLAVNHRSTGTRPGGGDKRESKS